MFTMWKLYICAALLVIFIGNVQGQYEDVRCKCVCPGTESANGTATRKVNIRSFSEPASCKCENVIHTAPPGMTVEDFCTQCECKWQRRNTTTIKVVVIIIICIVSLLFLYMLFLLCLDPLMSRRPKTYLEQHNEEVNLDTQSVTQRIIEEPGTTRVRPGAFVTRVKHEVSRVKGKQEEWKGTVQEQRRHIYDAHTMLN